WVSSGHQQLAVAIARSTLDREFETQRPASVSVTTRQADAASFPFHRHRAGVGVESCAEHFLTHTSGLAYPFTSAIWRDFKPRAGETYPFGGPLLFDPGERWHYGTSTDVVGKLVEVVSGQKLEDYFRQHIFGPLKMDDTSYNVPEV